MPVFINPTLVEPEVATTPDSPVAGQGWIQTVGLVGSPGLAMGPLGLTYTQPVVSQYFLTFQTAEGPIVSVELK